MARAAMFLYFDGQEHPQALGFEFTEAMTQAQFKQSVHALANAAVDTVGTKFQWWPYVMEKGG